MFELTNEELRAVSGGNTGSRARANGGGRDVAKLRPTAVSA
jgi:bacteriocin-like protein